MSKAFSGWEDLRGSWDYEHTCDIPGCPDEAQWRRECRDDGVKPTVVKVETTFREGEQQMMTPPREASAQLSVEKYCDRHKKYIDYINRDGGDGSISLGMHPFPSEED